VKRSSGREWARQQAGVVADSIKGSPAGDIGNAEKKNGYHPLRDTLTDWGNAQRFVYDHGGRVRYCYPWGRWLVYDSKRWVIDDACEVENLIKETVRGIYVEAANVEDASERKKLATHAKASESKKRVADALYLARSEPGIPVRPRELDTDPWLLNCDNGTVDLRTGELREHRADDLLTKMAPPAYDPAAEAPTFEHFLKRILPEEALRRFVRRAMGYAASGSVSEELLAILYGTGANGKSTLVNAVMDVLGDYATQAPPELLLAKRNSHPTELAALFGARFVASVEVDEGRRLAEGLVKQLTGRDRITARRMREDFWQFDPTHTVFLATNHRPEVRGTDVAIWRRIKLVPFEVAIPLSEQDTALPEKLQDELPGILAWLVRGCLEYQGEGLGEPDAVLKATASYRSDMDLLAGFLEDRCVVHENARAGATQLYNAYGEWCSENGETAETQRRFGLRLRERGFASERDPETRRKVWVGIGLLHAASEASAKCSSEASAKPSKPSETENRHSAHGDEKIESMPKKGFESFRNPPIVSETGQEGPPDGAQAATSGGDVEQEEGCEQDYELPHEVAGALEDPPEWLARQLQRCRQEPERFVQATCCNLAYELYGTAARWQEVRPIVEAYLREGRV
jgi:putative DNA primase/helicase